MVSISVSINDIPETLGIEQDSAEIVVDVSVGGSAGGVVRPSFVVEAGDGSYTAGDVSIGTGETTEVSLQFSPRTLAITGGVSPGTSTLTVLLLGEDVGVDVSDSATVEWVEGEGDHQDSPIDPNLVSITGHTDDVDTTLGSAFDVSATIQNDNSNTATGTVSFDFGSAGSWDREFSIPANTTQQVTARIDPSRPDMSFGVGEYPLCPSLLTVE